MHHFQPNHRGDEGEGEKQAPKGGGVFKENNTNSYGAHGTNAGPNGVSCANWNFLNGLGKKHHTEDVKQNKGGIPCRCFTAHCEVGLAQAERETTFKNSGKD